ncbi:hypothetical protein B0A49_05137 [Cryomyces minteri]|uniref:Atos-like conserved domain-containing protein n=1 Tax=Cryomyces minteri TaxID=331657 RepID=A0A4U0XCX4_9PEZI|nr:hypothetical protein B0A49_05137 [Cryomyces minteri]
MVGSYEESILRGRMSTLPSRPLNFMAQIGVLGKGSCRPNLRCPPHAVVPFPAVFYSYGNGNGRRAISDDQPSPYVGLIDLENSLKKPDDLREARPKRPFPTLHDDPDGHHDSSLNLDSDALLIAEQRKREKRKRRSASPKAPPGGSYRIPQQGQLQVVIKNPNKTAVKLFLIPYDLSDMEPGQKTFIRQRSYSAGPVINMPLSSRTNFGTDRPEAALSASDDPRDRPTLRYLIHLHICCPSRGRFYLYKSIRVVFANRVPDGKEKLRNEIQLPEPRYSTYKPGRESAPDPTKPHPTEHAVTGTGSSFPSYVPTFDHLDSTPQGQTPYSAIYPKSTDLSSATPTRPLPFTSKRPCIPPLDSRPASRGLSDRMDVDSRADTASDGDLQSPVSPKSSFAALMDCATSGDGSDVRSNGGGGYEKLSRGDVGYGGSAFSHFGSGGGGWSTGRAESLLAKRLRGLDVRRMSGDEEEMS